MEPVVFLGMAAGPLLIIAALLLILDFFLLFNTRPADEKRYALTFIGSMTACMFVIASYLILTAAFLADSFSFRGVYAYSSTSLSVLYKLGGPWIGSSGSLLFIAALLALGYAIFRVRSFEKGDEDRIAACRILDLFLAFFIFVTLLQDPFGQQPVAPPDGLGLNPLLQTPWVLSHPPIIFFGYVAVFFAFILFLAPLVSKKKGPRVEHPALPLTLGTAWLLLTIGIAIGGLWSYRVLGWGGYWSWDPVETASLLPWLALTAYFHVSALGKKSMRDLLLAATFFMVLFATALTRGGFSESVHAFGESPVAYLILGFAMVSMLVFFRVRQREEKTVPRSGAMSLHTRSLHVAAGSLVALLAVCFIGSAAPVAESLVIGGQFTVKPEFFTLVTFPFTLAFVAALIGCHTTPGLRNYALLIAAAAAAGIVLVVTGFPTPYALANLGLPLLIIAAGAVGYRWLQTLSERKSIRVWGRTLLHLAIVLTLIGVFISSAAQSETAPLLVSQGSRTPVAGSMISVQNFTVFPGTGSVYYPPRSALAPEYAGLKTGVEITEGSGVQAGSLWMYDYVNYGLVSEPLIVSSPARDLYISMHQTNSSYTALVNALAGESPVPSDVTIVVKSVPLIWLVWIGIALLGIGMGAVCLDELLRLKKSRRSPRDTAGSGSSHAGNGSLPGKDPSRD